MSADAEDFYEPRQEVKLAETGRRVMEKDNPSHNSSGDFDKQSGSMPSSYLGNGREEKGMTASSMDRERFEMKSSYCDSNSQKMHSQNIVDTEDKVPKVSPPRRKVPREEKAEKFGNWLKKDSGGSDMSTTSTRQHNAGNYNSSNAGSRQYEPEIPDGNINAILEVDILIYL